MKDFMNLINLNQQSQLKKFNVNIPISIDYSTDVRLLHEENINEYFINDTINANVNQYIEMEKQVYTPVSANMDYTNFTPIQKD